MSQFTVWMEDNEGNLHALERYELRDNGPTALYNAYVDDDGDLVLALDYAPPTGSPE